MPEVLRHFQSYKPASYNYSFSRFSIVNELIDPVGISQVAQSKDTFRIDPGKRRFDGA